MNFFVSILTSIAVTVVSLLMYDTIRRMREKESGSFKKRVKNALDQMGYETPTEKEEVAGAR